MRARRQVKGYDSGRSLHRLDLIPLYSLRRFRNPCVPRQRSHSCMVRHIASTSSQALRYRRHLCCTTSITPDLAFLLWTPGARPFQPHATFAHLLVRPFPPSRHRCGSRRRRWRHHCDCRERRTWPHAEKAARPLPLNDVQIRGGIGSASSSVAAKRMRVHGCSFMSATPQKRQRE
jgi:hypothetical protein